MISSQLVLDLANDLSTDYGVAIPKGFDADAISDRVLTLWKQPKGWQFMDFDERESYSISQTFTLLMPILREILGIKGE